MKSKAMLRLNSKAMLLGMKSKALLGLEASEAIALTAIACNSPGVAQLTAVATDGTIEASLAGREARYATKAMSGDR